MKLALTALLVATALGAIAQGPHSGETPQDRDARMKWWREARFGMFIHWGLYAEPAGVWNGRRSEGAGEWMMHDLKIPVADYAKLAESFDPTEFDADAWVALAKAAGMKYVVMTAKHHEGFAMYRSADPFGVASTAFKRDPIAEMAAACRKAGLKFGVYYSQAQDWHHAGGAAYGGHWDAAQDGDLHAYVRDVAAPQVRELMKYKPAVLWWDTPVEMSAADIELLTASLPRSIIMNDRLGNGVIGDTETPEQTIPNTGFPGRDWETCMTINDTWGYKIHDTNFKSTTTLLRNLIDIASKGGNYLLNVGPDARGVIPDEEAFRLREMGEWLRSNGRSLYGTTASPYRRLPFDGRATVKGSSLFLNVFEWPDGPLSLPGLKTRVKELRSVASGEKLRFSQTEDGKVTIERGTLKRTPISTAIELKLAGKPVVEEPELRQTIEGGATLVAADATLTGGLQVEHTPANVGYWTNANDTVSWRVTSASGFRGEVEMEYACGPSSAGSTFKFQVDGVDQGVVGTVEPTDGWDAYRVVRLTGTLEIPSGVHTLRIVPTSKPGSAVMNLRNLRLIAPTGR